MKAAQRWMVVFWLAMSWLVSLSQGVAAQFRAGASVADITPTSFPVRVNAMFTERSASRAVDPLYSRALVLDDGATRIVVCIVDTCMMPRDLIDEAKELARAATGIPIDRMLVSATHTHSAPSAMGCLGSRVDTNYAAFLPGRIAAAIVQAVQNLAPARVGWASVDDWTHTHNRRWIRRPDRLLEDPFGERNVRAHMHPGHESKDVVGPSGPVDPAITMLSLISPEDRPIALLANYSMHYYESPLLSADYFGRFASKIGSLLGATNGEMPFVGMMSQGTSGDLMWMDYSRPRNQIGYDAYAEVIAEKVFAAWKTIRHRNHVSLAMREAKLALNFRVPDEKRLAWAREKVALLRGRLPQSQPEIYAQEAIYLHDRPRAELKLQAIRIGDFGIAAIPNEVFAITGLKLKAQSPLQPLMNIELANGAEGYIPPPEQHKLGGYTTWAARTAGLETNAEPRIVESVLKLLEEVSGAPRRAVRHPRGPYGGAVLASKPVAFWRLNEFEGTVARNEVNGGVPARYEGNVALYLRGVESVASSTNVQPEQPNAFSVGLINRAPHLAGGRLTAEFANLSDRYSVAFWFWNGLPNDVRPVTAYLFSRGVDGAEGAPGDHVGIGGTVGNAGRLIFFNGNQRNTLLSGHTVLAPKTWNHLVLIRDGPRVEAWLNGRLEIAGAPEAGHEREAKQLFFGGRSDNFANLEGKIDEMVVFDRVLAPEEIRAHLAGAPEAFAETGVKALSGPLKPSDALRAFETEPGLQVEPFATEPLIASPCAIAFDEQGRMFVAENRGYPTGGPEGKPAGVVALLTDTERDGRPDKRSEFATGLTYPNGLLPWRGGLIVTCAPEVLYLKDTDGDGIADVKEVLLTGFATNQSTQLRVNKPMLALDGWVYLASGLSSGKITSPKRPRDKPLELRGDLRFNPDTGEYQHTDGKSQFGQSFDDFGRRFGIFNRVQVQHFVLPSHYVERNPHLASPGVMQNCPELLDNPFMRGGGGAARIYPISANITTADSHEGTFSAACAIHLWRGGILPREYDQNVFTCDPTGNLVHRDRLEPAGATFSARRVGEKTEFLRSRDDWFRPVYLETGPDGALYVCDMYRKTIEHPEYLPTEVRKHTDFESGQGMGRIWRVAGVQSNRSRPSDQKWFRSASPRTLVAELESPNSWRRDTAFRLLLERGDDQAGSHLQRGFNKLSFAPAISARLHLLARLGALDEVTLLSGLASPDAGVREVAVKLAELKVAASPSLQASVLQLGSDANARVRFQCALVMGELLQRETGGRFLEALASVALRDAADKWTRAAVLSSATGHERELLSVALRSPMRTNATAPAFFADLGRLLARVTPSSGHESILGDTLNDKQWKFDGLCGFLIGFAEVRANSVRALAASSHAAARPLREIFSAAQELIASDAAPERRVRAAALLGHSEDPSVIPILLNRLRTEEPLEIQSVIVRGLAQPHHPTAARELLAARQWGAYTPSLRGVVLGAVLSRPEHHSTVLDALESGAVPVSALDSSRRDQLRKSKNESIRQRAEKLFASAGGTDRQKAFAEARACLSLKPAPGQGREVFKRLCAACHRLDREGFAVGPDLFDVRNQPKESILLHIVIPEQEIAPNFANYTCETKDGRVLSGLIVAETATSVTIRQAQAVEETIARSEITTLAASELSLMPQELEKGLTRQELADLLGYLKGEVE